MAFHFKNPSPHFDGKMMPAAFPGSHSRLTKFTNGNHLIAESVPNGFIAVTISGWWYTPLHASTRVSTGR
jgi:hypothetical protein